MMPWCGSDNLIKRKRSGNHADEEGYNSLVNTRAAQANKQLHSSALSMRVLPMHGTEMAHKSRKLDKKEQTFEELTFSVYRTSRIQIASIQ